MDRRRRSAALIVAAAFGVADAAAAAPPHLLFLLVDDLGFAGVGFNSPLGEPVTPQIDALRAEGAQLARHYTYQFCSPTRSAFLSGRLPIHVNQVNHPPCEVGGGVPPNMTTVARMLKRAGYATHHAGKWHGGMSRREALPINRGFDSSLAMLSGAASHFTNVRACGGGSYVDMWLNDAPASKLNGTYSLFRYTEHALAALSAHDAATPFFLYMAFQDVHGPTQAPDRFLAQYNESIFRPRRMGLGQISAVDEAIGNLTAAFRAKGMWGNTLAIFSSDNGGAADHEPNYPLRGHKGTDFEGGVRVVAFVSGGWLPAGMRGGTIRGMMHIADWYATFAALAGVDAEDKEAAAAGLPPIDSLDMSAVITGANATSPRVELPLSYAGHGDGNLALISGRHKLVMNKKPVDGCFPGPTTPNKTGYTQDVDCSAGCLFDLDADETEHHDLAAEQPELLAELKARIAAIGATVYQSPGSGADPAAVTAAREQYGGFWGPWQPDGPLPTPAPPSPAPPVTGGFFLSQQDPAQTCLRAAALKKSSAVGGGGCDGNAHWDTDAAGHLYNIEAADDVFKFLRPADHYPKCTAGDGTRIGELTDKGIGAVLNGSRIVLTTCDNMCVDGSGSVVSCSDAAAQGWRKQPAARAGAAVQ